MRILMLGDNLTAYNDLPYILAKSLQAEVESITKEDARLFEFRNPSKELGKRTEEALLQRSWDYVVLQDQISRPVRFRGAFLQDVRVLSRKIRSVGAVPVLFAVWPYKPGTELYDKYDLEYDSLADGLFESYHMAAEKEKLIVADAGQKFREIYLKKTEYPWAEDLYAADGIHPSELGTRISAEVLAEVIREDWAERTDRSHQNHTNDGHNDEDLLKDTGSQCGLEDISAVSEYYEYAKPVPTAVKDTDLRIRVLHIYQILRKYTDEAHPLTTNQIIRLLEQDYGTTMHRTTVPGDIEALKEAGIRVVSRRARQNKYYLAEGEFELSELKILIDAVEASKFITEEKSKKLKEKLAGLTSIQQAEKLTRHTVTSGRARADNEKGYQIVDAVNEAINTGKRISFYYTDIDGRKKIVLRNDGKPYIISPYTLIWNGDFYYLLGFDHGKDEMRTYRVDRILDQPEILKENADSVPEGFDLGRYTREVFRMYDNEEVREVELLCSYTVMKHLVDQFGMDIRIRRAGKGWFKLEVNVCTSPTFYGWVFQFGGNIRISGPEDVREEYKKMAMKAFSEV